jgi:capsule polysaccharide export protein KpsE/RkpR
MASEYGVDENKRAELAGIVGQLEQQLARQRTNLAHLDATMRLFDPDIRPQEIRAKEQRIRSAASSAASVASGSPPVLSSAMSARA